MKVGDLVRDRDLGALGVIIRADIARADWLVLFGDGKKRWATTRWLEVVSASR